jgi:hypothetical protein
MSLYVPTTEVRSVLKTRPIVFAVKIECFVKKLALKAFVSKAILVVTVD